MRTPPPDTVPSPREALAYAAVAIAALALSAIRPTDRLTWFLEVVWVIAALPLLFATWRRFPFTRLVYVLMLAHALVLILGGHYTYAQVPLGEWARDAFDLERNHYDRLGHFMQGFMPALLARELLLRKTPLVRGAWLTYLCIAAALSFSAFFEMLEWWSALVWGADADAFLATQGDVWDTQWDMFLALVGASVSLALLSRLHDRQLGTAITEKRP